MTSQCRRALVLGLGRFGGGAAAARFLSRKGAAVRIADRSQGQDLAASRAQLADLSEIDWQLGREDEGLLEGVDLLVVNPAVPGNHPLLVAAASKGIALTQEANLFLEHYPGRVVAVTGTNGKSSTSTLLHAALLRSGLDALLGGNIGHSLLDDEARWAEDQIAVLEISSFQLERTDPARHRVEGCVLTRMLVDRVDRHGSVAAYHAAKSVLPRMAQRFCVQAHDDPVAAGFATRAARVRYGLRPTPPDGAGIDAGWLCVRTGDAAALRLCRDEAMALLGEFQRENALAAAAAASRLGASPHAIGLALATAAPLPFRLQLLATLAGVRIYDNGVSTEVQSTASALAAIPGRIRWVGGGKSKDGNFARVAEAVAPRIASAHLFGAAAPAMAPLLSGRCPTTVHEPLEEALAAALAHSRPGDAVLFSPAFASFDQYPNFRARALAFHAYVQQQRQRTAAGGAAPRTAAE